MWKKGMPGQEMMHLFQMCSLWRQGLEQDHKTCVCLHLQCQLEVMGMCWTKLLRYIQRGVTPTRNSLNTLRHIQSATG